MQATKTGTEALPLPPVTANLPSRSRRLSEVGTDPLFVNINLTAFHHLQQVRLC